VATFVSADPTQAPPVLVSRQPVLDTRDRVVGYRISYSLLSGGLPVAPSAEAASAIVDDVLGVIDRAERTNENMAHLPLTREMLLRGELPEVEPDQVLLRIRYEDATTQPLVPVIETAASRGYKLELDGLPDPDVDRELLARFKAVEIDFRSWDLADAAAVLQRIRLSGALGLAVGVDTHQQREEARRLGFDWFSGPFFSTPNTLGGSPIPMGDMHAIVELYRLQRGDAPLEELIALIEQEVGLGVRLLKYINSAYFGFSGRVRSITQAATMLGTRGLSRWALIVAALSGSGPIPRELALLALTRARACELVGLERDEALDSDELFTLGLISTCDAVFRMPIEQVVSELPLAENVQQALLHHSGPGGEILRSVIAYEQGEFLAPSLRSSLMANAAAYREALDWARRAVYGML
jgi:EAL and modified HD-GYP domain-containing signal transduction protein